MRFDRLMTMVGPAAARGQGTALPALADDALDPPPELLASWSRRVVAVVLDHALIAAATFLAVPVQPVTPLTLPGLPETAGATGTTAAHGAGAWWPAALVVAMMLGQAYLGQTPGKLVMGIAVVRLDDARPAGVLRTAARAFIHVLDGLVLMIGFLRPLWHHRRQTWADGVAGTVVIRTNAPLPVTPRYRAPVSTLRSWEQPARSPGRRWAWWVTAVACGPALALTYGPVSITGDGGTVETCDSSATPDTSGVALLDATVETTSGTSATISRLGIERRYAPATNPELRVAWSWDGELPDEVVELRVALTSADGTVTRTVEARLDEWGGLETSPGWTSSFGPGTVVGDQLVLPFDVVSYLGPGWTWTASARSASGGVLGSCAPAA